MKRIFLLIIAAGALSFIQANAQEKDTAMRGPKFGLGLDFAFPQGYFKEIANYAYGGSILYQHPVAQGLYITGSVGYLRVHGKPILADIKYTEGFIPFKVGARYFLTENLYGSGEIGVDISTANGSGSGSSFVYAPSLGVELPVADAGSIDLGLRYESWSTRNRTRSFIGIRAGFNF